MNIQGIIKNSLLFLPLVNFLFMATNLNAFGAAEETGQTTISEQNAGLPRVSDPTSPSQENGPSETEFSQLEEEQGSHNIRYATYNIPPLTQEERLAYLSQVAYRHLQEERFYSAVSVDFNEIGGYADVHPDFVLRREAWDSLDMVRVFYEEMLWLEEALEREDPAFFQRYLPFRVALLEDTGGIINLPTFFEDPYWFQQYRDDMPEVFNIVRSMYEVFPGRIFGLSVSSSAERVARFEQRAEDFIDGIDFSEPSLGSSSSLENYSAYVLETMRALVGVPTLDGFMESYQLSIEKASSLAEDLLNSMEDFSLLEDIRPWNDRIAFLESQDWSWYRKGEQIRLEKLNSVLWMKCALLMKGRDPRETLALWYQEEAMDTLPDFYSGEVEFQEIIDFMGRERFNDFGDRSTNYQWSGDRELVLVPGQGLRMDVNLYDRQIIGGVRGVLVSENSRDQGHYYLILKVNSDTVVRQLNPNLDGFGTRVYFDVSEDMLRTGANSFVFGILGTGTGESSASLDYLRISWE